MIETIISLKLILIFLLGILILDEIFVQLQTAETANFLAVRADTVGLGVEKPTEHVDNLVREKLIFTKSNPFFGLNPLICIRKSSLVLTKAGFQNVFGFHELPENHWTYSANMERVHRP